MNTSLGFTINGVDIINNAAAISTQYLTTINSPSTNNLDYSVSAIYTLNIDSLFNHMTVALVGGGGGGMCGQGDGGSTTPGASGSGGGSGSVAYMERIPLSTNGYSYYINVGGGGQGSGGEYKGGHLPGINAPLQGADTLIRSNNLVNYEIRAGGGGNAINFRTAANGGIVSKGTSVPPLTYSSPGTSTNVDNGQSGYGTAGGVCNGFPQVSTKDVTIINLTTGSSSLTGGARGINNQSGFPGGNSSKPNDGVNNGSVNTEYTYGAGSYGGGGGGGGGGNGSRRGGCGSPGNPGICIIYLYV